MTPKHSHQRQCTICLQQLLPSSKAYQLQACRHVYHQKCISDWSFIIEKCPLCRKAFSSKDRTTLQQHIPEQKRIRKHTNKVFQLVNDDSSFNWDQFHSYIHQHHNQIDWDAKDLAGLYLMDHLIMLGDPELVEIGLGHHNLSSKNGNGHDTLGVLDATIYNTNRLPLTERINQKMRHGQTLDQEEREHYQELLALEDVRRLVLQRLTQITGATLPRASYPQQVRVPTQ